MNQTIPARRPDRPQPRDHPTGTLAADNGFRLAAYDVTGGGLVGADGPGRADALLHSESLFVLLNGDTLDQITRYWTTLADYGRVIQSLAPPPGGPYGMVTDHFGVIWFVGTNPG